jgi:hypothetical protein
VGVSRKAVTAATSKMLSPPGCKMEVGWGCLCTRVLVVVLGWCCRVGGVHTRNAGIAVRSPGPRRNPRKRWQSRSQEPRR